MKLALLRVYVKPRARDEEIEIGGDEILFKTPEKPVGGRVNRALIRAVAKLLDIDPSRISIVSGHRSRVKVLKIFGVDQKELEEILRGKR